MAGWPTLGGQNSWMLEDLCVDDLCVVFSPAFCLSLRVCNDTVMVVVMSSKLVLGFAVAWGSLQTEMGQRLNFESRAQLALQCLCRRIVVIWALEAPLTRELTSAMHTPA